MKEDSTLTQTACRLAAKAFENGLQTVILVKDENGLKELDHLLWELPKNRFIPHSTSIDERAQKSRTLLVMEKDFDHQGELLINLTPTQPADLHAFDRIIEFVSKQAPRAARQKYVYYRSQGCMLDFTDLTKPR